MATEEWLTVEEARQIAECTRANILNHIQRGTFVARVIRVGQCQFFYQIERDSFDQWMKIRTRRRERRNQARLNPVVTMLVQDVEAENIDKSSEWTGEPRVPVALT